MGNEYDYFDEKDRWQFLSKELQQKTELIHRTQKDINDKSSAIKEKGQEVLELRKSLKQLKVENFKLHQKLEAEEECDAGYKNYMNKDIDKMRANELKNKMLKLA